MIWTDSRLESCGGISRRSDRANPPIATSGFRISCTTLAAISPTADRRSVLRSRSWFPRISWVAFSREATWVSSSPISRARSMARPACIPSNSSTSTSSSSIGRPVMALSARSSPTGFPSARSRTATKSPTPRRSRNAWLTGRPSGISRPPWVRTVDRDPRARIRKLSLSARRAEMPRTISLTRLLVRSTNGSYSLSSFLRLALERASSSQILWASSGSDGPIATRPRSSPRFSSARRRNARLNRNPSPAVAPTRIVRRISFSPIADWSASAISRKIESCASRRSSFRSSTFDPVRSSTR